MTDNIKPFPPVLRRPELSDEARDSFAAQMQRLAEFDAAKPAINAKGREALVRLMRIAQGDSGQCKRVAGFLLGLYNGNRFKYDMTDLRGLDLEIFEDCIAVLRMDFICTREVHCYFENGGQLFERLAKDWGIRDYTKPYRKPRSEF